MLGFLSFPFPLSFSFSFSLRFLLPLLTLPKLPLSFLCTFCPVLSPTKQKALYFLFSSRHSSTSSLIPRFPLDACPSNASFPETAGDGVQPTSTSTPPTSPWSTGGAFGAMYGWMRPGRRREWPSFSVMSADTIVHLEFPRLVEVRERASWACRLRVIATKKSGNLAETKTRKENRCLV